MKEKEYEILSSSKVNENKSIVISKYKDKGFTMGQKFIVMDGGKKIEMFAKNPILFDDISGLIDLRDALNVAISKFE